MYTKKVTIGHIAKKAKVSSATVSLILSGRQDVRIAEGTRETVLAAARSLGYVARKSVRTGRTVFSVHGSIHGSNIGTSFFSGVSAEMRGLFEARGMTFIELSFAGENFNARLSSMLASDPAAVISMNSAFSAFVRETEPSLPVFSLQGGIDPLGTINYIVDDRMVGEHAARHLIDRGYRNAAVIFPPEMASRCSSERYLGFTEEFTSGGGTSVLYTVEGIYSLETIGALMGTVPLTHDAYYFFSDAGALAGMRVLLSRGVRIPHDAGIIGTDNLFWSRYFYPSLSTMDLHERMFAERITDDVQALTSGRMFSPLTVRIPVTLIARESTGR
ncbi:MAG: LacI family DNA-binding transcriptional regulator [Spirochaetota bacterium]